MDSLGLVVSEIFGPTFQGEGSTAGRLSAFLRLGVCNLKCSWCDTPYTWDWKNYDPKVELYRMSIPEVLDKLSRMNVQNLVVTGGEPLIQSEKLSYLLEVIRYSFNWTIEIETAGTLFPSTGLAGLVSQYNVSPKLASSNNPQHKRLIPEVLRSFVRSGNSIFKFVVGGSRKGFNDDFCEIEDIITLCSIPRDKVWIMAEGNSLHSANLVKHIAPQALRSGFNFTLRNHTLIWGDSRGH